VGFSLDEHYLDAVELPNDAMRLYWYYRQRGYRDATIGTPQVEESGGGKVDITFGIDEGRPVLVDSISFIGIEGVEQSSLLRRLPLEEGDPLSAILLDATRDSLLVRLRNDGYAHADVLRSIFVPNDAPYQAMVEYDVLTGPRARFGAVVLRRDSASAHLSDAALLRMLPFGPGDVYRRDLVLQGQRNLFSLELVRNATIEEHLDFEPDSLVPLTVDIFEGDVHRVETAVGWSTSDCLNTETTWASRNFLGGARRLQVRGRVSNILARDLGGSVCPQSGSGDFADINWLLSAELFQPWFFSTRNSFTASVFAERQSLPDVFVRRAVGVTASLNRVLGPGTSLSAGYRPQLSTLDAAEVFFCTSLLVCDPEDIRVLQRANWLSPVGVLLTRARTNSLLNPSDGYQLLLDLEHASTLTGSEFAYNRVIAEGTWYDELARRTVWAARLRVGWVAGGEFGRVSLGGLGVIHPQKRFYAGGANSVRGFAQNRLGPRVLTADVEDLLGYRPAGEDAFLPPVCAPEDILALVCDAGALDDGAFSPRPTGGTRLLEGTLEYRFAFAGDFQAVLFTDLGQVWREGATLRLDDLEASPGVGVRYFSPIGPVRLDVAYRFREGEPLPVVTSLLEPFQAGEHPFESQLRVAGPNGEAMTIPWIKQDHLAILDRTVLFGDSGGFFRRFQLHLSIGQAF
jgi:outer membrane protein insertion porin family/translocation and assembly module TamA